MSRSRSYCYTLNNYTPEDLSSLETFTDCKYHIFGKEIGSNGTPHLQGFIYFKNGKSFNPVKKLFKKLLNHERTHIEVCKGSPQQNITYCKKENNYKEYGECPRQGTRTDLSNIREELKSGKQVKQIINEMDNINIQSLRGLQILSSYYQTKRTVKPLVYWIYGSTGTGKTRLIYDNHNPDDIYSKDLNTTFWEGYSQEKVLLLDDYRGQVRFSELLKILDRYPYTVNIKGSHGQLNSPIIYITSCYPPNKIYKQQDIKEDIQQLYRRIDHIVNQDLLNSIKNFSSIPDTPTP